MLLLGGMGMGVLGVLGVGGGGGGGVLLGCCCWVGCSGGAVSGAVGVLQLGVMGAVAMGAGCWVLLLGVVL